MLPHKVVERFVVHAVEEFTHKESLHQIVAQTGIRNPEPGGYDEPEILLSEINSDDPLTLMSYIGDALVPGYVEQEKLHEILEKVRAEGE